MTESSEGCAGGEGRRHKAEWREREGQRTGGRSNNDDDVEINTKESH